VVEQSTGEYGVTAGYSTDEGILGELSLTERNFLGRGQYVRAAVGASGVGKTFDFSFTEPRFMGLKVSSGFDLWDHITSQTSSSYYGLTAIGGQVRLGMPVTDTISASTFVGFEQQSYAVATTDSSGNLIPSSQVVNDGQVFNKGFVGYNVNFNTLDDQKNPTTGVYAVFTQRYDGIDYNDVKTEAKARYFMPFGDTGIVGSIRGQAGVVNHLGGGNTSSLEAFREDSKLVRGFAYGGYGPRLQGQNGFAGEFLGETAYAGLSAEVQFPIPMLPESYGLDGAFWADTAYISGVPALGSGTLDPGSTDNPFKASAGASIIWNSPFGPLRGDFGYVLSKASSDQTQVFQLTLQTLL